MNNPLTTAKCRFRLFKQPRKIGDTFELDGSPLLIIGIENFEIYGEMLTVWYTCQHLKKTDYANKGHAFRRPSGVVELDIQFKYDDRNELSRFRLGSTHGVNGEMYKIIEYTEISLKGTDLYLSFISRPVYPVDQKEARAKLFSERRKKLGIEVL